MHAAGPVGGLSGGRFRELVARAHAPTLALACELQHTKTRCHRILFPVQRHGRKVLVLDPSLTGPLSLLDARISDLLSEHGISRWAGRPHHGAAGSRGQGAVRGNQRGLREQGAWFRHTLWGVEKLQQDTGNWTLGLTHVWAQLGVLQGQQGRQKGAPSNVGTGWLPASPAASLANPPRLLHSLPFTCLLFA